jgi:hypothetical protein
MKPFDDEETDLPDTVPDVKKQSIEEGEIPRDINLERTDIDLVRKEKNSDAALV